MTNCFFISDLHGQTERYNTLFKKIEEEIPSAVFLGGDLMPSGLFTFTSNDKLYEDFFNDILIQGFTTLKKKLADNYPSVFLILGNDDGRQIETDFVKAEVKKLWKYIHNKKVIFGEFTVYGYSFVPPTPFLLKDWERYDVSRYVDPGCVPPEDGYHTVQKTTDDILYSTIQKDMELLVGKNDTSKSIFLFHTPPYQTKLDRAELDGKMIEHVPLDVHVGSIAVKRFIEERSPLLTLHGHIHESARLTGAWKDKIGKTFLFSAAHDGPELALVRFNPEKLQNSTRELI